MFATLEARSSALTEGLARPSAGRPELPKELSGHHDRPMPSLPATPASLVQGVPDSRQRRGQAPCSRCLRPEPCPSVPHRPRRGRPPMAGDSKIRRGEGLTRTSVYRAKRRAVQYTRAGAEVWPVGLSALWRA